MMGKEVASAKMANMAWFCAVLVVVIHVNNLAQPGSAAGLWFRNLVVGILTPIAVPFFFLASGWFLGRHIGEPNWWPRELKKRVRSLVIPFALLTAFCICIGYGHKLLSALLRHQDLAKLFTLRDFLTDLGLNPFDFPGHDVLWFIRALMVLVVISPPLFLILRKIGVWLPIVIFVLASTLQPFIYDGGNAPLQLLSKTTLNVTGFSFFTLGLYLRLYDRPLVLAARRSSVLLAVAVALIAVQSAFQAPGPAAGLSAVPVNMFAAIIKLCLIYGILGLMPPVRLPLVETSFAVFTLHTFVTGTLHTVGDLPPQFDLGYYLAITGIAVIIPMGIAYLLKQYMPRLADLIFGGR